MIDRVYCVILMSSRVRHFCFFTSSYAFIMSLHDDPGGISCSKIILTLIILNGDLSRSATNVRYIRSGEQTKHTQIDREIIITSPLGLVSQFIQCKVTLYIGGHTTGLYCQHRFTFNMGNEQYYYARD